MESKVVNDATQAHKKFEEPVLQKRGKFEEHVMKKRGNPHPRVAHPKVDEEQVVRRLARGLVRRHVRHRLLAR
eukprot:4643503-Pleurochrysis_carterae.AAC.1